MSSPFTPEEGDVRKARNLLFQLGLPTELVLEILDHARYWPEVTHQSIADCHLRDNDWTLAFSVAHLYFFSQLPGSEHTQPANQIRKIREIEFLIVSHDQGWTTEDTSGTYDTSSWFEASIFRPKSCMPSRYDSFDKGVREFLDCVHKKDVWTDPERAALDFADWGWNMVPRPSGDMEPQRLHCPEMAKIVYAEGYVPASTEEGRLAWWLQGNQVARGTEVFDGDMVKRYRVVWGCKKNPRWQGNEGAGKGDGFVDSLRTGDVVGVWVRAKRRGWENRVCGVRMTLRYTIGA
ncbi:uncharacterized protein BDR25DRAFT_281405 [Lindgomyces ingoldianus]|uniref:Uncharacterized protein n=1 Tax=Lindgomyces ingoldianus TaxID=673940 RepID=A0ACB6R569_9PLEO|nr:uncharacterized protein BDR25DRAFT_281405 [Lindgomyces ingoldianus]KAF2474454.1 hypothetical protein BDR25DRAFT_281405 [Lindgomyces ingoldianus]